jgi:type IV secretory pathway VirB4 component
MRRPRRPPRPSEHARAEHRAAQVAAQRAERAERRARSGERPPLLRRRSAGLSIPVDWHRSTMAHLCSMYPFHADRGFGDAGIYFGTNITAGLDGFYYDPFAFYDAGLVENPNIIVTGTIGSAKSGTVKALIKRCRAVYPDRFIAVLDPKGEYTALAEWLGLPVVKLQPGGRHQLNPMEAVGDGDPDDALLAREGLTTQMVSGVLGRPLSGVEEAVIGWGVGELSRRRQVFTIGDLNTELDNPSPELLRLARQSPLEMAKTITDVRFALQKLCDRTLRGMFDGPTNVHIDWRHGPGVVLDLSAIHDDPQVLPLVMLAASYWLGEAMRRPGRQKLQVIDEAWAAIRHGAGYMQSSSKLSRQYGLANVFVCHRPRDLTAQNDDGTASAKIAAGLLADIETRVLLRQPKEEVPAMAELFDLSEREQQMLPVLQTGRAIWKVGLRSAVVQTVRSPEEIGLFFTDHGMKTSNGGPDRAEVAA